jgi:hypothetical protein
MLGPKKKSTNRLSGLFSKGSSDSQETASTKTKASTPSESTGRLSKVRNRLSSATHLAPDYPRPSSPSTPRHVSAPTAIQPVESKDAIANLAPLEPPPPIGGGGPGSRPASPSRSGSRPGTPSGDSASEGNLKKLRRKSNLFGSSRIDLAAAGAATQEQPPAWIVGLKGKVPYNLAPLLSGEKVGRSVAETEYKRIC